MVYATPEGMAPDPHVLERATKIADSNGASIRGTIDPREAVADSGVIYTDVFISMGEENLDGKADLFSGFQVNDELVSLARPDYIFMHCLPAHRGDEVTDSVIDSGNSVVFDQAENRMWAQMSILTFLMVGLVRLTAMGERDNAVYSGLIWLFAITLLVLYEGIGGIKGLKHTGLIGNFSIALAIGMDVLFGAAGLGGSTNDKVLALAGMALAFSFAREVIKDIEDVEGDFDRITFPKKVGLETARAIAWLLTLLALILLIGPFLVEIFPIHHIILVAPGAFLLTLVKSKLYLEEDKAAQYLIKRSLQISMIGVIISSILVG